MRLDETQQELQNLHGGSVMPRRFCGGSRREMALFCLDFLVLFYQEKERGKSIIEAMN